MEPIRDRLGAPWCGRKKKAWRWSVKRAASLLLLFLLLLRNRLRGRSKRNGANRHPNGNPTVANPGTAAYGKFVKNQLAAQDERKGSFEQRGVALVTTAGALVTLLFGLAAFATTGKIEQLPHDAKTWLAVALVVFVIAAVLALATNFPFIYDAPKAAAIRGRLKETPIRDEDAALRDIAFTRLTMLEDAKTKNKWKGRLLFTAMAFEVGAVAFVGVAIFEVIHP